MESLTRQIINSTDKMNIKTTAGQLVIEWNEGATLAQWTIQQIIMFSRRPNVPTQAREEAQDAIIEAMIIKDKGSNWNQEQGEKLAYIKEQARQEVLTEESRIDSIQNIIEEAELKWSATESRAKRWQNELDQISTGKKPS